MIRIFGRSGGFAADEWAYLRRIERKLDLILAHLGLPLDDDGREIPEAARALADQGDKIGAIKAYRQATGAGLAEAKRAVEAFMDRPRGEGA